MTDSPRTATGKLVVISGPSGAGKTTVCRELKKDPNVVFSVSATTRPMREGEENGVDYHFMTPEEFEAAESDGAFLESAVYNGNRYGTLRAPVEVALRSGRVFLLEIEVQGTQQLRDSGIEGDYVFVVPPSMEELRRRIVDRGTNSDAEIAERMAIAEREMQAQHLYDHVVVNATLGDAIAEIRAMIGL